MTTRIDRSPGHLEPLKYYRLLHRGTSYSVDVYHWWRVEAVNLLAAQASHVVERLWSLECVRLLDASVYVG